MRDKEAKSTEFFVDAAVSSARNIIKECNLSEIDTLSVLGSVVATLAGDHIINSASVYLREFPHADRHAVVVNAFDHLFSKLTRAVLITTFKQISERSDEEENETENETETIN